MMQIDVNGLRHSFRRDQIHIGIGIPAEEEGRDTNTDFHKELKAKHQAAWGEIHKAIDVGEFLISVRAVEILRVYLRETEAADDPNNSFIEMMEVQLNALNRCLPAIKAAARADLRLPSI